VCDVVCHVGNFLLCSQLKTSAEAPQIKANQALLRVQTKNFAAARQRNLHGVNEAILQRDFVHTSVPPGP
jgi:hypothetical protein